jgi:ketosteroid isomerase-like protein
MGKRAGKEVRRTFQVVFYGVAGAGKTASLRALRSHLPGASELVEIPNPLGGTTMFFDAHPPVDRRLAATLRLRAVVMDNIASQAFLGLIHCDALVFVVDAAAARAADNLAAWDAAVRHFATYHVDLQRLPIVIQVTNLDRSPTDPIPNVAEGAPRVQTNPSTGDGMAELAQTIVSTVLNAFHDGRAPGRKTTVRSQKVVERAHALAAAVDIAAAIRGDDTWTIELSTKQMALNPELGFESMSSLASLETTFFTYWHEGSGSEVDAFWREVERQGLPFRPRDVAAEVLARGKITNRGDYETITDLISDERFSEAEKAKLGALLAAYESKSVPRRRPGRQ